MQCETVRIAAEQSSGNPAGYIIINRADYDPAKHEIYGAEAIQGVAERDKSARKPKAAKGEVPAEDAANAEFSAQSDPQSGALLDGFTQPGAGVTAIESPAGE